MFGISFCCNFGMYQIMFSLVFWCLYRRRILLLSSVVFVEV